MYKNLFLVVCLLVQTSAFSHPRLMCPHYLSHKTERQQLLSGETEEYGSCPQGVFREEEKPQCFFKALPFAGASVVLGLYYLSCGDPQMQTLGLMSAGLGVTLLTGAACVGSVDDQEIGEESFEV